MFRSGWCRRIAAAAAVLAWARGATAAPSWTVDLNYSSVTWNSPFSRDSSCTVSSSNSESWYSGHGAGSPGAVSAVSRIETTWWNGLSGGGGGRTYGAARADDFVISGPGGSVAGTLHLRVIASFELGGGYPGNGGHGAHVWANLNANGIGTFGDYNFNNGNPGSGTGLFSGFSGPVLQVPVSLSGNFPVNSPFSVQLLIQGDSGTYGNAYTNPGLAVAAETVLLDDQSGQVMTLPEGYTLNSPSWNVVNNAWSPSVAVTPPVGSPPDLRIAGANPSAGDVTLACSLPAAGFVRVAICDLGGRLVRTLASGWYGAGEHTFVWDGRTEAGLRAPDGVYFAQLAAGGRSVTRRIVRVR